VETKSSHGPADAASLAGFGRRANSITDVRWGGATTGTGTGTVTVAVALQQPCSLFVASGTVFAVSGADIGVRQFQFSYRGRQSQAALRDILRVGDTIMLQ